MIFKSFLLYVLTILILGLAVGWRISQEAPPKIPRNQKVTLLATVKKEPKINDYGQVVAIGNARLFVDLFPRYRVGDRLRVEGEVDDKGRIFQAKVEKIGRQKNFLSRFTQLRTKIYQNIASLLPAREATVITGTVLGIEEISQEFREALIKTGTIHVVVVSGQNLMIVAGVFLALAGYLGRKLSLTLATITVFGYAFLTGFEPPVVRASLMVTATTLAIYFGRESLLLWNLAIAALIILFIWPQAIFEISFQLTFAATFGIATLGQSLAKSWQKLPFLGQNAAIATSAYLWTAPVILFYFGKISPLAPLANILIAGAVFPIMILGFAIAFFSLTFAPLAQLLAYLAFVPAFYFVKIVEIFAKIPLEQIELGKGNKVVLIGFYLLLLVLIMIWRRNKTYNP